MISSLTSLTFARRRLAIVFRRTVNVLFFLVLAQMCVNPRKSNVSGLPWIKVKHLASHILSQISRRISNDWEDKYGHRVYLLETFVDTALYRGTCYKAANWCYVGQTKGRTRNDRDHMIKVTVKDIYVYPLVSNFKKELSSLGSGPHFAGPPFSSLRSGLHPSDGSPNEICLRT
jgi:hypothetical protein